MAEDCKYGPVTISPNNSGGRTTNGWLVECSDHSWFKERAFTAREFAEAEADRHLKTYHNKDHNRGGHHG